MFQYYGTELRTAVTRLEFAKTTDCVILFCILCILAVAWKKIGILMYLISCFSFCYVSLVWLRNCEMPVPNRQRRVVLDRLN